MGADYGVFRVDVALDEIGMLSPDIARRLVEQGWSRTDDGKGR